MPDRQSAAGLELAAAEYGAEPIGEATRQARSLCGEAGTICVKTLHPSASGPKRGETMAGEQPRRW